MNKTEDRQSGTAATHCEYLNAALEILPPPPPPPYAHESNMGINLVQRVQVSPL